MALISGVYEGAGPGADIPHESVSVLFLPCAQYQTQRCQSIQCSQHRVHPIQFFLTSWQNTKLMEFCGHCHLFVFSVSSYPFFAILQLEKVYLCKILAVEVSGTEIAH